MPFFIPFIFMVALAKIRTFDVGGVCGVRPQLPALSFLMLGSGRDIGHPTYTGRIISSF